MIGAAEDVAEIEETPDATVAEKPIHRIAAILAMGGAGTRVAELGTTGPAARGRTTRCARSPGTGNWTGRQLRWKEDEKNKGNTAKAADAALLCAHNKFAETGEAGQEIDAGKAI